MKKTMLLMPVVLAGLLTGCFVISVAPFYSDKDLVFDQALLGKWVQTDKPDSTDFIEFKKADEKEYVLAVKEDDTLKDKYEARLFKLGNQLFLDLLPLAHCEAEHIPVHQVMKVQLGPRLELAAFKYDWLKGLVAENPAAIRHEKTKVRGENNEAEEIIVLTASTKELQEFVLKHLKNEEAWAEANAYKPLPANAPDTTPKPAGR